MIREQTLRARQKLVSELPITGELLRGSLLERTVRHTKDCPKCARGEGHQVFVLTVTYPGGRTRQFSVRRERVAEVRRWLSNYQELKEAIEAVCAAVYEALAKRHREVRANLVYRDFTHVGAAKMPDAKTMGRWGLALGPAVLKQVHERIVTIAREQGVTAGQRMRVDTTVVETDIHHPTDST